MPHGTPPRQLEPGRSNRFLAILPPHDFAMLTPHLRTVTLEHGVMLHDVAEEIERVRKIERQRSRQRRRVAALLESRNFS
jgi:hypothetical protein